MTPRPGSPTPSCTQDTETSSKSEGLAGWCVSSCSLCHPSAGNPTGTHRPVQGQSFPPGIAQEQNAPTSAVAATHPPKELFSHRTPERKHTGTSHCAARKLRHAVMQLDTQSTTEAESAPLPHQLQNWSSST